ncbi:MAG: response regulator transcription factor [Proteobacteria bacterium]|nr:response regulator transcription factor [Pseudomonadota bacterium]
MRLLLADDHSLFRDALVQYIERAEPDATVALARDVHELMEVMAAGDAVFDLILLDMRMPGMDGLQGLVKIKTRHPDVPVAIISGLAEKEDVEQALSLGAAGYFPKTMSGKALVSGIREIIDGKIYIARDHNTNEIMPSHYHGASSAKSPLGGMAGRAQENYQAGNSFSLTPREREVLSYLRQGVQNKEIARALDLQIVTVKLHVRSICRKLNVQNRTQAALKAQEAGL